MYEVGTRNPEVELGSPMPKLSLLSHLRMVGHALLPRSAIARHAPATIERQNAGIFGSWRTFGFIVWLEADEPRK